MTEQGHVGKVIDGRYRLDKLLGRGGMGAVYLGYHVGVGRRVAVKILRSSDQVNPEEVARFHREARAAAAIGHNGIIDIFDVGNTAWGDPYLVMEHLEGESLETLLERLAPFDLDTASAIAEQLLLALAAAHDKNIIHRDVKPGNIVLVYDDSISRPTVKLIDFGLSKIVDTSSVSKLTQSGTFMGTPSYVAPEQATGDACIDQRVDLYAVGVVLYEMLTGELPFIGKTFNALILNIVSQPPRPPHEVNPRFPSEAGPFLERALDKRPEARFQTATEMLESLRALGTIDSREQGLGKLTSVLSRSHCAWGDLGAELDFGFSELLRLRLEPSDLASRGNLEASQAEADRWHRLRNRKGLGKTTKRLRTAFGVSIGAVVVTLVGVGFLMLEREPMTHPAAAVPAPAQPPVEIRPEILAAPAKAVAPDPPVTSSDEEVERPAPDSLKLSSPSPKAAKGKRPAKVKPGASPESPRFIKGGRQTEIVKDFE